MLNESAAETGILSGPGSVPCGGSVRESGSYKVVRWPWPWPWPGDPTEAPGLAATRGAFAVCVAGLEP